MRVVVLLLSAALTLSVLAAPTGAIPPTASDASSPTAGSAAGGSAASGADGDGGARSGGSRVTLSPPEGGPVDDAWLPGPSGAAFAQFDAEPPPGGGPVWPGVRRDARRTALADGKPVDVQILNLEPGAEVQVRPTLAGGSVRGLSTVAEQSGNPLAGSVAAVNGGFWLQSPPGEPNGLFLLDDRMISDAETQGAGPRGTAGWTADGRLLIDRIDSREQVILVDGTSLVVDGINRGHREYDEIFPDGRDSLLAYTSDYGGLVVVRQPQQPPPAPGQSTEPPAIPGDPGAGSDTGQGGPVDLAAVRIAVPRWPATGVAAGTVTGLTRDEEATFGVGPGEVLLVATASRAAALDGVQIGDTIILSTTLNALDPARDVSWTQVSRALAGGPMVVKDGRVTDPGDWVNEGFEPHVHSDVRAPRTAIGVTADGRTLLVVADGRRPGITHGFTIGELGQYMVALGAVEALSLDGGGSSQIVVDGILRNVPCCDSSTRRVADSLQIVHGYPFAASGRLAGQGRIETAATAALHGLPDGARSAVVATASAFPDALAGGPLAGLLGGPLLLTSRTTLPAATLAALRALGTTDVWLLGGEAVISTPVEVALQEAGFTVRRLAGGSRFDTAAAVSREVAVRAGPTRRVFLTPAGTFPDALLAGGPGGMLGMPVLLTDPGSLHPATRAALEGVQEVVVIDSDGVLGAGLLDQVRALGPAVSVLGGGGRYATAAAVNRWLRGQTTLDDSVVVTRGGDFPDALAGGPLAARTRSPLMLLPGQILEDDPAARAWFDEQAAAGDSDYIIVLGGVEAVTSYEQWQLDQVGLTSRQQAD